MKWEEGNAELLANEKDESYDFYTIAFGLRNVTNRAKALKQAWRVLRKGGKIFCLEMSKVQVPLFREIYDWYSFKLVPSMGDMFAKDMETYKYLVESVKMFPNQEELRGMFIEAGFSQCSFKNMTGGIVAIHQGTKL